MSKETLPPAFLSRLEAVRGRRARIVVEHILEHGQITSEELQRDYGYEHPPRAIRDVREQGIPIETFSVTNSEGRKIAAYRFGDPCGTREARIRGRIGTPKWLKPRLIERAGARCAICLSEFEDRFLQVDHRVPFEVAGDEAAARRDLYDYMLVCSVCNRAKSWSCEHCRNWRETHDPTVCHTCYWAAPDAHTHVAMVDMRRLDIAWIGDEVTAYDRLRAQAAEAHADMPDFVKKVLVGRVRGSGRAG